MTRWRAHAIRACNSWMTGAILTKLGRAPTTYATVGEFMPHKGRERLGEGADEDKLCAPEADASSAPQGVRRLLGQASAGSRPSRMDSWIRRALGREHAMSQ